MSNIQKPPYLSSEDLINAAFNPPSDGIKALVQKINSEYEYWDKVKYKKCPAGCSPLQLWTYVKAARRSDAINVWRKYSITLPITNQMQKMCHKFDINFRNYDNAINDKPKERYLISSLMEEAIFSSMMEGAATTRKVAKEMLRKKISPKDKSQQMIVNNYLTIQFVVDHKDIPLTKELLLKVHRLITEKTMDDPQKAGIFRTTDDVVVENGITHEVVHQPPSYKDIPEFIDDLCQFFNEKNNDVFIHPIMKGIIIHFMIAFMHPFVDGNGRTARALFYWYMLKQGYALTQYLSISRVIASSKNSYEKAFLYTEADNNDMGYFAMYNLKVLNTAFNQLQSYIKKKQEYQEEANTYLKLGNINERQAQIIKMFADNPNEILTVKDVQSKFLVSPTTAKADLIKLVERDIIHEFAFNKVKKGYERSKNFNKAIKPYIKRTDRQPHQS